MNLEPRRREVSARDSATHRSEVDVSPEPWEANAGGWRSLAAVIEKPPFVGNLEIGVSISDSHPLIGLLKRALIYLELIRPQLPGEDA